MFAKLAIIVTSILILSLVATNSLGQEESDFTEIPGAEGFGHDELQPGEGGEEGGFGLHFQVGVAGRLATTMENETKQSYLVTGDLTGLNWSRTKSTWGAGIHFALDDSGHRLGLKGIWRTPLKKGTWNYIQVAPGLYVSGTDDTFQFKAPSFFVEAEWGVARQFSLVLAIETIAYEDRTVGYVREDPWDYGTPIKESGTAATIFGGCKAGQEGAVALTALGIIAGIAVLASLAASGGPFG